MKPDLRGDDSTVLVWGFFAENCWFVCRIHLGKHSALRKSFSRGMDGTLNKKREKQAGCICVLVCVCLWVAGASLSNCIFCSKNVKASIYSLTSSLPPAASAEGINEDPRSWMISFTLADRNGNWETGACGCHSMPMLLFTLIYWKTRPHSVCSFVICVCEVRHILDRGRCKDTFWQKRFLVMFPPTESERYVSRNTTITNMLASLLPTGNLEIRVSWLFLVNRDV